MAMENICKIGFVLSSTCAVLCDFQLVHPLLNLTFPDCRLSYFHMSSSSHFHGFINLAHFNDLFLANHLRNNLRMSITASWTISYWATIVYCEIPVVAILSTLRKKENAIWTTPSIKFMLYLILFWRPLTKQNFIIHAAIYNSWWIYNSYSNWVENER